MRLEARLPDREEKSDFQDEPDNWHPTYWRDLVLAAARETDIDWEGPPRPM